MARVAEKSRILSMTETLIGWIFVFCLFPGVIALSLFDKKGRNGWYGFLLGCFLSYLGVLIALILPRNIQQIETQRNQKLEERRKILGMIRGTMKRCGHCNQVVDMDATKCRYCGKYV